MKSDESIINRWFIFFRLGFGLVFVFSGGLKLANLADFSKALSSFGMIPELFLPLTTFIIPVIEIVMGISIVVGWKTALMSQFAVGMLVMFTAVIVAKLSEGAEISCACFGPLSSAKMSGTTVGRNIALLCWGILVFALVEKRPVAQNSQKQEKRVGMPVFGKNVQGLIGFLFVFFLAIEVILLSKQNNELKSRLAMLIGGGNNVSLKPNDLAPPFKALGLEGQEVAITYHGESAKTLLLIFSTSCGACERNLPNWSEIVSKMQGGSCRVMGISLDPLNNTKNYVLKSGIHYPVFVPVDIEFSRNYKLHLTPQTVLIDNQGRVEQVWIGVLESSQKDEILIKLADVAKQ
jgi:peroxiredoxin/uncharacterized membrane protein YphA (DoxX/SURF4 family)